MNKTVQRVFSISLGVFVLLFFSQVTAQAEFQSELSRSIRYDCGQQNEKACPIFSTNWRENGSGGCDRGLVKNRSGLCVNKTREQVKIDPELKNGLANERVLSLDKLITEITWLGAHNAYNNAADGYFLFPNQLYSITDQLRMGIRAINLDVHWFNRYLRVCHGTSNGTGCAPLDRLYFNAIAEINQWLRKPENLNEIILITFEDHLDGHIQEFLEPIQTYLGDLVLMANSGLQFTSRELLKQGKRVILLASDPALGNWAFTHAYFNYYPFTKAKYFRSSPDCTLNKDGEMISLREHPGTFTSFYEDRITVWGGPQDTGLIDTVTLRNMLRCKVSEIEMDQVTQERIGQALLYLEE